MILTSGGGLKKCDKRVERDGELREGGGREGALRDLPGMTGSWRSI